MSQPTCDDTLAQDIGSLLRVGVVTSAFIVLIGGTFYLIEHGRDPVPDRTIFVAEPPEYSRPLPILREAMSGRARPMIQVGLLLLIATPVLRVFFSALALVRRRDWLYLGISSFVFVVLMFSLFSGQIH